MIRLLAGLAVFYLFRLAFRALFTPAKRRDANRKSEPPFVRELVHDPICGIYLPSDRAIKLEVEGKTVHFCSEDCRSRWRQEASSVDGVAP